MGNGQSCKIVGIGDVCLETELGCKLLLKKVRHVPEIRLNLISTGQLDDEGYSNEFSNGRWKLSKGSLIVARGQKTDTLYRLHARHNSDDHSRKVWAYPMRTKDQVIEIFKNFHVTVERETGMKLKCVRADNGEFEYKFWDPDNKKIIRSRDVVFFEDQTIENLQKLEKARISSYHEISIPVLVDVEHPVEEVPGEYEKTMTGGEIPQYVLLTDGGEPEYYDEAVAHEHKEHWLKAMNEEMNSLFENHTYDLVKLPGSYLMAIKASKVHRFVYNGSRIHCGDRRLQGDVVVAKVFAGVELEARDVCSTL
ncbi:hypothetical protein CRG98_032900 [Punica granatum]|uniref:Uncharacterized protein n=1 Tax=Punica granatum TaxID=22663 RepID=A0A2I0IRS8_PUNGR|nr:hypothetical protein CRG98_032900 [Punica granatum]